MLLNWLSNRLKSEEDPYPAIQVDDELLGQINAELDGLDDDNGGPLLLVRPPRENDGMDASISVYETLHNPRERKVGFGPFSAIKNNSHAHAHEIWYHDAQMQFFLRPETRVDANKIRRQVRSNYRNVEIREVDNRFPSIEEGEYVSIAKIGLKRDFYFPIKAKLHNDDSFDLDPYGDITSDMVVEEDETSDGQRVEAKDCKLIVQTIFEAARDVWNKSRPYGVDVSHVAQGMKEGEVHGNMLSGFEVKNASALTSKSAKILDTLQGAKGYYVTMRVIAISPYEEIAQRRCRNVAYDFETYYNSITQQGLTPVELTEDEMRIEVLEAAKREHNLGFRDRFMSNGKFLQPVEALGAIAHIPNEDVNTPVIDWAKQDTGPGTPSGGTQLEDEKREAEEVESGLAESFNSSGPTEMTDQRSGPPPHSDNTQDVSEAPTTSVESSEETEHTVDSPTVESDSFDQMDETQTSGWGTDDDGDDDDNNGEEDERTTPAFASNSLDDGWGSDSDETSGAGRRQ